MDDPATFILWRWTFGRWLSAVVVQAIALIGIVLAIGFLYVKMEALEDGAKQDHELMMKYHQHGTTGQ